MLRRRTPFSLPLMPGGVRLMPDPRARKWARRKRWASRGYRMTRWTVRRGWTHRRGLAPVYGVAALTGLATIGHDVPHGMPAALALWVWVSIALGIRLTRRNKRKAYRRLQWAYIAAVYLSATALLIAGGLAGPAVPVRAALFLWFAAAGAPWWHHHRVRPQGEIAETDLDERVADWAEFVAVAGGPGAGSELADVEDTEYGWTGVATMPRGKGASGLITATEQVASAYDRENVADVTLEQVAARRARVTVYEDNPLTEVKHWPGPQLFDPGKGVSQIGTYADGGAAMYRWYKRGSGPVHDLIAGATDGGKSRLVDQLLATERACPFMASVVIDPQSGQSLPEWKRQVAVFARGTDEGLTVLHAVHGEMKRREAILSDLEWVDEKGRKHDGVDHFDPLNPAIQAQGMKLICLTIEEASTMLKVPGAASIVEELVKQARKCGIKIRLVVQVPLLDQLGGSHTLRSQVAVGNVIVLRTGDRLSGQVAFNGVLPVDPFLLPREWPDGSTTAGLGFVLGPGARSVPMRILLVDDPYYWAHEGETTQLAALRALLDAVRGVKGGQAIHDPADSVSATKAGTIADRAITWLEEHETGMATTGSVAEAIDEKLPSVSTALTRAAKAGRVRDLGHGMWGRTEAEVREVELVGASAA